MRGFVDQRLSQVVRAGIAQYASASGIVRTVASRCSILRAELVDADAGIPYIRTSTEEGFHLNRVASRKVAASYSVIQEN